MKSTFIEIKMPITPERNLDPEDFRCLIEMYGMPVKYFRAIPCPHVNPEMNEAPRDCPLIATGDCVGAVAYREQQLPAGAKVLFQRARKEVADSELGFVTVGDLMAYTMPDWIPLERLDRIVAMDWQYEMRETRRRGTTDREKVTQKFPFALDAVSWLIGDSWEDAKVGEDVTLEVDESTGIGEIVWQSGKPSAIPDTNYSVIYRYRPTFYASGISLMPSRPTLGASCEGDSRAGLPVKALLTIDPPQANNGG